jgi:hypothetical protein
MRVMHELPMCPQFQAYDVIEFIVENRKIKQARAQKKGDN